ncbi:MAG: hypothetical protein QX199_04445 [Methylococcaceae bacterium]
MLQFPHSMRLTNLFGREMPASVRRDEALSPHEQHKAAKEQMMETIIHHAEGVQAMLKWVDSVTLEMTRDEVAAMFDENIQKTFKGIPFEFIERMGDFEKKRREYPMGNSRDSDLWNEIQEMRRQLEKDPNFFFVREVVSWSLDMVQAWTDVYDLRQKPLFILIDLNEELAAKRYRPLIPEDIVEVIFEPFCVHIVVTPDAYQRLDDDDNKKDKNNGGDEEDESGDSLGFFLVGTHFTLVKGGEDGEEVAETARHESGHHLIEEAHSFGNSSVLAGIRRGFDQIAWEKTTPLSYPEGVKKARQRLWRQTRMSVLDELHNEFLAELNVARHLSGERLEYWHWATAENRADDFAKTMKKEIKKLRPIDPKFATKLSKSKIDIAKRFEEEKGAVIDALQLASVLPDPDARSFVVALAFVTPIRSYHHMEEILERKYSPEVIVRAERRLVLERRLALEGLI